MPALQKEPALGQNTSLPYLLRGGTVMGLAEDRLDAAALADGRQRSGWFWAPALRLT